MTFKSWISALLLCLGVAAPDTLQAGDDAGPEHAFAYLLFGDYFQDPCANTSKGVATCPPQFAERQMHYRDIKADQAYRFENNPCIVHAETTIAATGEIYRAVFNLQNVLYVNLSAARQEGNLMEVEFFLQGREVIESNGKMGNVLVFIHKYYATDKGDIGHDPKDELVDMRKAVKRYQERFCPTMG
jgi:hypothetical protein